ncbi:MAG: 30S ribosomal protein S12 methylthiotransferase RimO [Bacteroidales bacterium]|nr:30S ribosomal protein S12 methylthiotransferase RimO [Bacteroidales bacterium]
MRPIKINIITLGCSKNIVDSEHVAGHLTKAGFELHFDREKSDCDITIVNTCGFIGDAKEESVNILVEQAEIKRRGRKQRKLYAVGCLVERYRNELAAELPEIDGWYGVHQWSELIDTIIAQSVTPQDSIGCGFESQRTLSTPSHYAYLKISEGCDRSCSYCAIPQIRGPHVSRPIEELVDEAKRLVANGVKEIIVIAQDTTYYGVDIYGRQRLGDLLTALATESGASWIRLHYTYPTSFPKEALKAIASHDNICNYIDIPLQHINTLILKSMHRDIDHKGTVALLDAMRKSIPDVAIRTTLIVGYPGETEKAFEELKDFVRQARFDRLGVFEYSPEEGTPAFALGDTVAPEVKQRRREEIMELQSSISLEINEAKIGKTLQVMLDRQEGDYWIGRTQYDSPEVDNEVIIALTAANRRRHAGEIVEATVTDASEYDLNAVIAE